MKRISLVALAALMLLEATACETPETGLVGEPPDQEMQVDSRPAGPRTIELAGDDQKMPDKTYPQAIFGAAVWPFLEEGTTFELTWGAQPATLTVHEQPDPNSATAGEYKVQKGDRIPWRNTWVGVYKPALFTAKNKVELSGTRYAPDDRDLHAAPVSATVHPGQSVAVYHYAGAATCYLGAGQVLMQAPCPTPQNFEGDFSGRTRAQKMHPEKRIWWVYVSTRQATGWIPVDDRVLVDILNT